MGMPDLAVSSRMMAKYSGWRRSSAGSAWAARIASESLFQYENPTMARPRTSPTIAPPRPNSDPMPTIRPPNPARRIVVLTVLRNMPIRIRPATRSAAAERETAPVTVMVVLLRGINVGGKGKLPMADLRAIAEDLGYG